LNCDRDQDQPGRHNRQTQVICRDVRWVKISDIHLTLKFLGDVEEERIPDIGGCIEQCVMGITPFTIAVRGMGAFPSDHSPQVIWIAAADESGTLSRMQLSLEDGLARLGFKKEKRPFSPHLTLGRLKSPRGRTRCAGP